jgi:CO dehydrogenase/acetyl-CoA synthase gamma subunit (corrinoid Fe-S protein)
MNMLKVKTIIPLDKDYYNKNNCKFILCDSCFWFATILKNVDEFNQCPICKKKKIWIERILR